MAASLRLSNSLLRATSKPALSRAAYSGVRAASTQVRPIPTSRLHYTDTAELVLERSFRSQAPWRDREDQEAS